MAEFHNNDNACFPLTPTTPPRRIEWLWKQKRQAFMMSPGHWDEADSLVGHSFLPPAVIQATYGFWNLQIIIWIKYWIWYTTLVSPWSLPQASRSDELHLSHSTPTFHEAKNHHGKHFCYHIASQSDGYPVTLILRNSSRYLWGTINVYFQSIILFQDSGQYFMGF